jgi:hypothetical protein
MEQKQLIEKAIEYHGRKKLPEDLDDGCLLYSKLIRDAEKMFGYVNFRIERNGK